MRQEGEPSVEEILESIKKVIARDNRMEADEGREPRDAVSIAGLPAVDDPALGIPWPLANPELSAKDKVGLPLKDLPAGKLFP